MWKHKSPVSSLDGDSLVLTQPPTSWGLRQESASRRWLTVLCKVDMGLVRG